MGFGVDTEAMSSAAGKVGLAAERIDDLLNKMRDDVNTMLSGWAGDGADAHRSLHARYEADVRTINGNLRDMQVALENTHQLYVTQETQQSNDHIVMRNQIAQ